MKKPPSKDHSARLRAELIMKVRCGIMSAQEAATRLGVSRKTYYKWEERGLVALLDGVADQSPGRPQKERDARQEELARRLFASQRQCALLENKLALKDVLMDLRLETGSDRAKKYESIRQALAMIDEMKQKFSISYAAAARQMGLSLATLMRWKRRLAGGRVAAEKRGPKKVVPLDLDALNKDIVDLDHGRRRSRGTGRLYGTWRGQISRRDLDALVREVRNETNRRRAAETSRVSWLRPNLAWAMDDCARAAVVGDGKLHLHNISDLSSRYKLPPIAGGHPACSEEVAGHLAHLFERFYPPLFCKRDNGGNLNHTAVNEVLPEALVIPINNPVYTAPYNSAIEHTQGEFKDYIERGQWKAGTVERMALLSETAAHDLNHQPRRCLQGRTACRVYFGDRRLRYTRRQRKKVYHWIRDLATEISVQASKPRITRTACRVAARQGLVRNGLITIRMAGNVLPNFSWKLCQN